MQRNEIILLVIKFISNQFPRTCRCCGKTYYTIADYTQNTIQVGKPISYDADDGDWNPVNPIGLVSIANCICGTSLAISSHGMSLSSLAQIMEWARIETQKRNETASDILENIRIEIAKIIIQNENQKKIGI